jgi:serine/threonine protein kinase
VPVYFVDSERGVHFYAMQFINGQTLAAVIRQLRAGTNRGAQPAGASTQPVAAFTPEVSLHSPEHYRTAAQLGIQAAEALDHAHQLGIVHRDVKPANLMVDVRGHLWVTDFGLARIQIEASLTLSGDLMGTLRYMSPEQALARREVVDHRTDIYSLGATLYELLTLQPAFTGTDREELLRQIALEEPRPLRRLSKGIPVELETIVLKAMEKEPAERYSTAQDLADDLLRLLEDRPIRARQATTLQRLRKWARRQRALATTVGAFVAGLIVIVIVALAIGLVAVEQER